MKKPVHLGSWSLFCDLSGRVQEALDNPIITIAAVGVPHEVVRPLRTKVRRLFPGDRVKWKYGKLDGLEATVTVIAAHEGLYLAVYQAFIANPTLWQRYFQQGKDFIRERRPTSRSLCHTWNQVWLYGCDCSAAPLRC